MKRCKICGQLCDDSVRTCPVCKNSEFAQEQPRYTDSQNAGNGPWQNNGQNAGNGPWQNNDQNVGNGPWQNNDQNVGNGPWQNNGQNAGAGPDMNYGMPTGFQTGGEKMNRRTFYKKCIPPSLRGQLTAAYIILVFNIIVLAFVGIMYDEKQRFIDLVFLIVILAGLICTKHVIFAVIDLLYFGISFLLSILTQQVPGGYLAVIIAIMLIPATSRMGKLWRRYKRIGEYIDYEKLVPKRRRWPAVVAAILVLFVLGGAAVYVMSDGMSSYEEGTWNGNSYENEYLELQMELPLKSGWKIADEEELEELEAESQQDAGLVKVEEFDFLVSNSSKSATVMLRHMKSSLSQEDAFEQIKESLLESYRSEYGSTPDIVDSGEEMLAGNRYHYVTVKGTVMGVTLYESIYVRKVGREICELGFTGLSEDTLEELQGYITRMK